MSPRPSTRCQDVYDEWDHGDGDWSDGYAYYQGQDEGYRDSWWDESWDQGYQATTEDVEPVDDEKYKEAQQAERVAESLALEAQRTWADAQRATQALRRDRGFGGPSGSSTSSAGKCFACGGNHFIRDCPAKGKGKLRSYVMESDDYIANYIGKERARARGSPKAKRECGLNFRLFGKARARAR